MYQAEQILFTLKRSLLEYALKNRIEYIVDKFACKEKLEFSQYNINSIRFELYNMYILVKHQHFNLFETLVEFLTEFHTCFSNILDEKLYYRVLVSIKAMLVYDSLKKEDLKKSMILIKEYFPKDKSVIPTNQGVNEKIAKKKNSMEVKILTLRSEWNELLLSKSKRDTFFEKQFAQRYDDNFFNFLLIKVKSIFDVINEKLPLTQLEEIMRDDFQNSNLILFNQSSIALDGEDEIRFDLFMDNLKLHKIYLETQQPDKSPNLFTDYIKKLYKNLAEWQSHLHNMEMIESQENYSESLNKNRRSVVHEILFLDSFQIADEDDESEDQILSSPKHLQQSKSVKFQLAADSSESLFITNDLSKASNFTNDLSKSIHRSVDSTTNSGTNLESFATALDSFQNKEIVVNKNKLAVKTYKNNCLMVTDLLTDDEKDTNISI